MSGTRALWLWGPVAVYAALLFHFSGRVPLPRLLVPVWDKALHAGAYGAFALLVIRAFHGGLCRFRAGLAVAGALTAIVYGAIEELRQGFIPGRFASVGDLLADAVGAVLAVGAARFLCRFARSPQTGAMPRG